MRASLGPAVFVLFALALPSCAPPRPVTEMVVTVDADAVVRAGVRDLNVEVYGGPDYSRLPDVPLTFPFGPRDDGSGVFPRTVVLVPEERDASRVYRIVATAALRDGRTVVAQLRSGYVEGRSLRFRLFLAAECVEVECGADLTCSEGICVEAYVDPQFLVEDDRDAPDGMDAPRSDSAPPLDAPLSTDVPSEAGAPDRDAGSTCSGRGDCDDGFSCTLDDCSDGACQSVPTDALCITGIDPRCAPSEAGADPSTGCVATPCDATTCVAAPCETAACIAGRCERTPSCADGETCCAGAVCGVDCAEATACLGHSAGFLCRAATDLCDAPETCDGTNPGCPPDAPFPAGMTCRPATGSCDAAESCNGTSTACPDDGYAPALTACGSAGQLCDGLGACITCSDGASCASDNPCEAGVLRCSGGPRCEAAGPAEAGILCRAASGDCDVEERCTGSSTACPVDRFAASTVACRSASEACDAPEFCSGTGPMCPADLLRPSSFVCRGAAPGAVCDVAERCTGSSADCPPNGGGNAGTMCRASSGSCDPAEFCSGVGVNCPPNGLAAELAPCGPAPTTPCDAQDVCDDSGTCTAVFAPAGTICDDTVAGLCDAPDVCAGTSAVCVPTVRSAGSVCRAVAGVCDVAEACDGSSSSCPTDRVAPPGNACMDSFLGCAGACDGMKVSCGCSPLDDAGMGLDGGMDAGPPDAGSDAPLPPPDAPSGPPDAGSDAPLLPPDAPSGPPDAGSDAPGGGPGGGSTEVDGGGGSIDPDGG